MTGGFQRLVCRILGHDWGEVSTRLEAHCWRDEGLEMNVTRLERDYRHCPRCGDEHSVALRPR